jgi:hypothetical protein
MPQHFEGWDELEKAEVKDLAALFYFRKSNSIYRNRIF